MADGRIDWDQRLAWRHTSHILAWLENTNALGRTRMTKPDDRNPYTARSRGGGTRITAGNLSELTAAMKN